MGKNKLSLGLAVIFLAVSLIGATPSPAQDRYPAVARLSFVSGPVTYSRGDDPDEWDDAIENVPLTIGDRIYAPEGGRAELQLSAGNFVRLAPRSYFSTLNLSDDIKQFYLGEGAASFSIRRLQPDEVIEIDTPNVSVTLDEPGNYRIAVDENGDSRITVRRGRVMVAANGRQIAVENSEIRVYGIDSPRYEIVGLAGTDAFDRWVTERDDRFARTYTDAYRHTSDDIIGAEDLAENGRWEQIPEYGYAWTPSRVAAGWTPFSDGRWYWQDPWGWSWISNDRWGWATSHYGRWTPHRSRWYWVPVRPRTRVRYDPACVEFVRHRDHVGWFPLHPRDRHIPRWERRDRQRDRNVTYINKNYVTVVNQNNFISARPVNRHIVRDSVIVRDVSSSRFTDSLPIPNRSSIRVVSETGERRGQRPSPNIVNRAAVVRTAPPLPPRAFQDKLPEIQKNQGKPIEPARIVASAQDERARAERVRIRPAAEEGRGDFAPRNPGATAGSMPQPLTEARGKKLATRENPVQLHLTEQRTTAPQPAQSEPGTGNANKAETPKLEQEGDRQRQLERERQAQQQELDRRKQEQQKEAERKAQAQKQQQQRQAQQQQEERKAQQSDDPRRPETKQPAPSREQQRLEELERRQAQQEQERKAQAQQRREQERREQLRQKQLQQGQAQQQKQQALERTQQEQERNAQGQQQQQEQARREQLRQQQLQERQAREQQRLQDLERRQQQLQREQDRNAQVQQRQEQARVQQLRQQQAQEREAQQLQRQQEPDRRQQLRQQQIQERQLQQQQLQRPPAQ